MPSIHPISETNNTPQQPIKTESTPFNPAEKAVAKKAEEVLSKERPPLGHVIFKAETKEGDVSRIRQLFHIAPELQDLLPEDRERIFEACLAAYQRSIQEYEAELSPLLFNHPDAKDFAKVMCQRMGQIVEAFRKVEEEENPSKEMAELRDTMIWSRLFGASAQDTGSVGFNPFVIKKAIKEGNLRKQMTLIYKTIFSFLLNDVLKDKQTVDKVNAKLIEMKAGFQLDSKLIEEERSTVGTMIKAIEQVDRFRNVEKGRKQKPPIHPGTKTGPKVSDIQNLTLREARAALENPGLTEEQFEEMKQNRSEGQFGERRLKWLSGQDFFAIGDSTFTKETKSLGLPPSVLIAGPSGTTDGFLHVARYIGLGNRVEAGTLACLAWMIPARDHSMHEVLISAAHYGFPYQGLPEDFDHCFDPTITNTVKMKLEAKGLEMPSACLSSNKQLKIAQELGILFSPAEKVEIATILADFETLLAQAEEDVQDPGRLNGISMTPQLSSFNLRLKQLEAKMSALEPFRDRLKSMKTRSSKEAYKKVREEHERIRNEYQQIVLLKMEHVKERYPDNPVYAMANPRTLPAGLQVFSAGAVAKMNTLLTDQGFEWREEDPATGYAPNYHKAGLFGMNEMGEKGHYFSTDSPAYLSPDLPVALECRLKADMNGVSILPVRELEQAKFSPDQIEKGYKQLQQEYAFLQHAGLPPRDSEVVIMHTEQKLQPTQLLKANAADGSISKEAIPANTTLHPSWDAPVPVVTAEFKMRTGTDHPTPLKSDEDAQSIQVKE